MTHISKLKMKESVARRISNNLVHTLFSASNGKNILHALLTPTERTMLAKRLALILMLEKQFSYYRISKSLKISTSTIKRIHKNLETGMYEPIRSILRGKKKVTFLELLETMLSPYGASKEHRRKMADIQRRLWAN